MSSSEPIPSRNLWKVVWRSGRLRCPACGRGPVFRNLFSMHPACSHCGLKFVREPGFYLGSIYVNYGLTALIVSVLYPLLLFGGYVDETPLLIVSAAFVFLFPVLFFPFARSLWLGFDHYIDPQRGKE
ncbi:MAG: DUF983 domain-containing protein [Pirellulaceae bacterium]